MKRLVSALLSFAMIMTAVILSGCGGKNAVTGVSMTAQEYVGSNIYELPRFDGEGETADQLNASIQQELTHYISGWESIRTDENYWYELRSYPICGQRYKQVVVTAIEFPNYGTDGDVFSFCYDSGSDAVLTIDDAFAQAGVSRETVEGRISQLAGSYLNEGDVVVHISCAAFAFAGNELYVIARALIENDLSSEHDELFVYNTAQDAMDEYTFGDLFPAGLCDQLEPPLTYSRGR